VSILSEVGIDSNDLRTGIPFPRHDGVCVNVEGLDLVRHEIGTLGNCRLAYSIDGGDKLVQWACAVVAG